MIKNLPPYVIRESPKAKRVILRISAQHGLEVVIPSGFSRKHIPRILQQKSAWLERTFRTIQERAAVAVQPRTLPEKIYLAAKDLSFTVEYVPMPGPSLELTHLHAPHLRISGACENLAACRELLKRWLQYQGRVHLIPWLQQVSSEIGLSYQKVQIRGPKSRWGSCSSRGSINLSYHLLFLLPELVRSIIVHELCHTVHLNHSADFYQLWGQFVPNYRELRTQMQQARQQLPWWSL